MEDNHQITLTEWAETKRAFEQAIMDVKTGFVRTGYYLRKIRDGRLYENDGYDSLAKWAQEKYNLNGSTVSRLITINEQYSEGGFSRVLDEKYKGFSFGMLVEMKNISPEGRQMLTPETPREDVRELRRYEQAAAEADPEEEKTEAESEFEDIFRDYLDTNFTEDADVEMWEGVLASSDIEFEVKDIICPAGQKMWRNGGKLLMFKTDGITIKKSFFGEQAAVAWGEFIEALRRWTETQRARIEWREAHVERDDAEDGGGLQEDCETEEDSRAEEGGSGDTAGEPVGDDDGDLEEVRSGETEEEPVSAEKEVAPAQFMPEPEPVKRGVADISTIEPAASNEAETVESELVDSYAKLVKKALKGTMEIRRQIEAEDLQKAADLTRRLLRDIERLENMKK